MKISEKTIEETGLSIGFIAKEIQLTKFLYQWPLACAKANTTYALFGGTAINKAFLGQPRFSEDVDVFLYSSGLNKASEIISTLQGFKPSLPRRIFGESYRWKLEYEDEDDGLKDSIQLDLNLSQRKPKTKAENRTLDSFLSRHGYVLFKPQADVLPLPTLLAMKLNAIQNREEGKDYYDVYQILSNGVFAKKEVVAEAWKYHDSLFNFINFDEKIIEKTFEPIRKTDARQLASYDAFILKPHRPDWGALKKDLVRMIRTKIR